MSISFCDPALTFDLLGSDRGPEGHAGVPALGGDPAGSEGDHRPGRGEAAGGGQPPVRLRLAGNAQPRHSEGKASGAGPLENNSFRSPGGPGGGGGILEDKLSAIVLGDGGGAVENAQRSGAQEDGGQLQLLHQPHEAAGEEAQTLHQQIQVRLSLPRPAFPPSFTLRKRACVCEKDGPLMSLDAIQMFHGRVA